MNAGAADRGALVEALRFWLQRLEAGGSVEAPPIVIAQLSGGDHAFYRQVADLTQRLHKAVSDLRLDERLARIAGDTIPDARDRLQHVVGMTEAAAHRTLDLIDSTRTVTADFSLTAQRLAVTGDRLVGGDCEGEVGVELGEALREEAAHQQRNIELLRSQLNDMATAQEYQDITGQIIKKVIALVEEVDAALAELLQAHGGPLKAPSRLPIPEQNEALPGPALPGRPAANQQDADALLDSLGF